ncbi:hypothetical protein C3941_09555 [Kaistia algarum]|uniref:invasion associated locus B family protein n=1 Tax=Kaistia algarum TaxID=2083279 RepID=UPI000CE8046D|nr:invasion associated locus B family protein [Kaistia algarum]MCX5512301.1 invasion associated locus B family protein [Kaistia algarum]PPE80392.1 hypothetical protein C3941_09555 [Kaistia algarum]
MADSFNDEGPPDGRPILPRLIEGACVVAFVAAVILWQSDGTLNAARNLLAGWGLGGGPVEPILQVAGPVAPPVHPVDAAGLDPAPTGSISAAPPLRMAAEEAALAPSRPMGWQAACDDATPRFCTASQSLAMPDDPSLETSWTIEKGKDGLFAVWTTPTDVQINRGMSLVLGSGAPKIVPFQSCGRHSCEVRAKLAGDFIALLRKSGTARTEIIMRGGRTVTFDFTSEGLDAALDKLGS